MRELDRPIVRVLRRMRFQAFLAALVWCLASTLAVVVVTFAIEKLTRRPIPGPDWVPFVIASLVAVLAAVLFALLRGPSRVDAAIAIDRKFALNDRISSALTLPEDVRDSPVGRALMGDVTRRVADLDVRSAFNIRMPRLAWVPLIPVVLAVGILFIDNTSRSRVQAKSFERLDRKVVVEQTKSLGKKIASQRKEIEKGKFPEAEKLLAQIEKAADDLAKSPPTQKDKALVEMNKLTDALKERQKQLGSPEQINRQLQQLKDMSNQGPADQFAKDLAKGEFQKAANELKKLQEKLTSGKMTEADKKQLKEQLSEMSNQLQKLANLDQRKQQLDEALKSGTLSREQHKQEMEKLEQQKKGLEKLAQMAKQLDAAQQAMEKGDMKKAAETLGMSEKQLADMAKSLQELESLDGALADLQDAKNGMTGDGLNQLGDGLNGLGQLNSNRRNGQNGGSRGRGQGDRPEAPDQTSEYTTKVKQQFGKGKAVVEGTAPANTPIKGRSVIEIQAEIETSAGNAAGALSNQKVPRNIEKHVQGYFDQINKGK